jgi:Ca2+-binding RTX toxin-like protein
MRTIRCGMSGAAFSAALLVSAFLPVATAQAATPTCFGKPATHVMQPGEGTYDTRNGLVDVVVGTSGADTIRGPGEFGPTTDVGDYLCGGPGNDRIFGSAGPDHINGGDGDDNVEGWRGADVVQGNAGNDRVDEGSMDSQDRANDILRGGIGNDTLIAGWGKDKAYGDDGSDKLYDLECDGPTVLDGGGGNDSLESYSSSFEGYGGNVCHEVADQIVGGTGTDSALIDRLDKLTAVEKVTTKR